MSQKSEPKKEELIIPAECQVFDDKRTHAKTLAMPFQFADGKNGILMISRLYGMAWKPSLDIEKVVIHFK